MSGIIPKIENKFYQLGNAYQQFIDAAKSLFVLKSGDTMTGDLGANDSVKIGTTKLYLISSTTNTFLQALSGNLIYIGDTTKSLIKLFGTVGETGFIVVDTNRVFFPVQAPTASAPAYVKGGLYFDTTLNKLRVGGATAWETVTSA